jgi:hypothetical protein
MPVCVRAAPHGRQDRRRIAGGRYVNNGRSASGYGREMRAQNRWLWIARPAIAPSLHCSREVARP